MVDQGARFDTRTKLMQFPERLVDFVEGRLPEPLLCELYPTYACQLRCPWCDMGHTLKDQTDASGHMPRRLLLSVVEQLSSAGVKAINWSGGGEPTLHPDILEAVTLSKRLGMSNGMFTNGLWGHDARLWDELPPQMNWIRFSLNSGWNKTLEGAQRVLALRERDGWTATIGLGVVITNEMADSAYRRRLIGLLENAVQSPFDYIQLRPNHLAPPDEVAEADRLAKAMCAMLRTNYGDAERMLYRTPYKFADGVVPARHYDICYSPTFILTIGAEGFVWHCPDMVGKDPQRWSWGSLHELPLVDILNRSWIEMKILGVDVHKCPPLCKGHETNKALWDIMKSDPSSHPGHL